MQHLQKVGEDLLPGVAYGDAAGLPVEAWPAERIKETYSSLDRLIPTKSNPYFRGQHEPGTWSDDTQLSVAVAEALIDSDVFDLNAQATAHIQAYQQADKSPKPRENWPIGWGKSTTRSVRRLMDGVHPLNSGEVDGGGNGVLMKMAPLVFWHKASSSFRAQAYWQLDELTRMTHNSPEAIIASRIHADVLSDLLSENGQIRKAADLGAFALGQAILHEAHFGFEGLVSEGLKYLTERVPDSDRILDATDGNGLYCPQTLAMTYGAFMMGGNFTDRVYGAVNLGGDTDSTAAIVAAMSVFADRKIHPIPEDFEQVKELDRLKTLSRQLAVAALRG